MKAPAPGTGAQVLQLATTMTDEAMLEGLRRQSPGAQSAFFRRYHGYVERLITRVMGFDRDLPDLVQDVFLAALKGVANFRGDHGALSTWLGQIAIRTAQGCIRKRKALRWLDFRPSANLETAHAAVFRPEDQQALAHAYTALDKLPTNERVVFVLRAIEGMDVEEVCSMLNISPATVKRRTRSAGERFSRLVQRDPVLRDWLSESGWVTNAAGLPTKEGSGT